MEKMRMEGRGIGRGHKGKIATVVGFWMVSSDLVKNGVQKSYHKCVR
jgi:hypothetical protein